MIKQEIDLVHGLTDCSLQGWEMDFQRCKKRQIWQIRLCVSFPGGANFYTDRNKNRENYAVRSVLLKLIVTHYLIVEFH